MAQLIELIPIGYSAKSRGVDGQFKTRIEEPFRQDVLKARAVFINLDGSKVPFLIESATEGNSILLKLQEVDTPEQVSALLNKELYLEASLISSDPLAHSKTHHPLTGYQVINQDKKQIGKIEELIEYPNQLLAKIIIAEKAILLPVHEDLILNLNESEKVLQLEIAEGLLDL